MGTLVWLDECQRPGRPTHRRSRGRAAWPLLAAAIAVLVATPLAAQEPAGPPLVVEVGEPGGAVVLRLGPVALPAGAGHHDLAHLPDRFFRIPFDGWITSWRARIADPGGAELPGRLLHHVAIWNTARADLLCPEREEHVFGAGGELAPWPALPGFGVRVARGDRFRVSAMFHNPTPDDHPAVVLEVTLRITPADGEVRLTDAYPVWFDVQECGRSDYDLPPGPDERRGAFGVPRAGRLAAVGGHLHDHGVELALVDATRDRPIAVLEAETEPTGRLLAVPVASFLLQGGYRLEAGDVVEVSARYDNPTGRTLVDGAMGIVVGMFVPEPDAGLDERER